MKVLSLQPVENCIVNGYSLIDNVFGAGFAVYDMLGGRRTTARNRALLRRAQAIVEDMYLRDAHELSLALEQLRREADTLRQEDYDLALWHERRGCGSGEDGLHLAGSIA